MGLAGHDGLRDRPPVEPTAIPLAMTPKRQPSARPRRSKAEVADEGRLIGTSRWHRCPWRLATANAVRSTEDIVASGETTNSVSDLRDHWASPDAALQGTPG